MAIAYHIGVPFGRNEDGDLMVLEPVENLNAESARRRAQAVPAKYRGAIALGPTGDPNVGEFDDGMVLASYGR